MPQPTTRELLDVATEAAYLAGRRAMALYNVGAGVESGLGLEIKGDDTPVTIADKEGEQIIRRLVSRHFPDHSVLGEEMGTTPGHADYRWIIDPIDGTKSFIHGVPMWGVLVGVEVRGEIVAGVCYHAATDEMVTAGKGLGACINGRPARASSVKTLAESTLICTAPHRAQARGDAYDRLQPQVRLTRGWGDCYGYTLIATGRAEITLDPRIAPWDCAPFAVILPESGAYFGTWAGERTIYGPDFMGCAPGVKDEVTAILASEKKRPS